MGSPCPPHWTLAARAAYFGERMCAFCDHRNPAGARFCNDCASPLHLKPCAQCNAINDQPAQHCYQCGTAFPALISAPAAARVLPAADATPATRAPGDVAVAATLAGFVVSALRGGQRALGARRFVLAGIATILIVGAFIAYRMEPATRVTSPVASQSSGANQQSVTAVAPPADATTVESGNKDIDITASLATPVPATPAETPNDASLVTPPAPLSGSTRASVHQHAASVAATKRTSAHQRAVPQRQARGGAKAPATRNVAAMHGGARVAQSRKTLRRDPGQLMQVSLARCGGDLMARIACNQRVRKHFCEGHWGEAPHCTSGVVNDHGQ
jgi:double zinc ribbon protein